jgi:hypothetical protein
MLVISCIKQVPDTTQVQIDPVTNTLIRDGIPFIINPYEAPREVLSKVSGAVPLEFGRNRESSFCCGAVCSLSTGLIGCQASSPLVKH